MSETLHSGGSDDVATWAKEVLDVIVNEMMERGIVSSILIEAKPIWVLPYKIMIGQVRETHEQTKSIWVIGGDVPIDSIETTVASTPRDVARHFALKWQLDAARYKDPAVQNELGADLKDSWDQLGERLARKAEALFELVEDENLWQEPSDS